MERQTQNWTKTIGIAVYNVFFIVTPNYSLIHRKCDISKIKFQTKFLSKIL